MDKIKDIVAFLNPGQVLDIAADQPIYAVAKQVQRQMNNPSFEAWCEHRKLRSPQFNFWYMVLSMELVILLLIRLFREDNFFLYCQSLAELIPYFFTNNNVNYVRWLPIHYRDTMTLEQKHPQLAQEFQSGNFVVHKSSRRFSAMVIDQAHE